VILSWCTVLRGSEEGREGKWEGGKDGRRKEGSNCEKESDRAKVKEIFSERGGKREREKQRGRERERDRKRERERERERERKRKRKRNNK